MKLLFLDVETTGVDNSRNGIIQLSGIIEIDGIVKEEFNFNCRPFPGQLYDARALEVTGTTIDQIKAYPDPKEIYTKLLNMFNKYIDRYNKNDKFSMVGQNVKFDYDFMTAWFQRNNNKYFHGYVAYHLLDIMALSNFLNIAGRIKTKNMKLQTIADYFGIEFKAHDSFEDIKVTRDIFYKYLEMLK